MNEISENFLNMTTARNNAVPDKNDYIGEDGLIRCGRCGGKKETVVYFGMYGGKVAQKVRCICKCEEELREKRKQEALKREAEEKVRRVKAASLMDSRLSLARFENNRDTKYNSRNMKICRNYALSFTKMKEKNQGLLMWGSIGTGKSFAAACIANYLLDKGVTVVMTSFVKLLEIVRVQDQEEDIINKISSAELVIFDDLGAERGTEYALEKVYNIVDSRYRANKPMIITTNRTLQQMYEETDPRYRRVYDRIFEVCYPIEWTGPSWRRMYAKKKMDEFEKEMIGE